MFVCTRHRGPTCRLNSCKFLLRGVLSSCQGFISRIDWNYITLALTDWLHSMDPLKVCVGCGGAWVGLGCKEAMINEDEGSPGAPGTPANWKADESGCVCDLGTACGQQFIAQFIPEIISHCESPLFQAWIEFAERSAGYKPAVLRCAPVSMASVNSLEVEGQQMLFHSSKSYFKEPATKDESCLHPRDVQFSVVKRVFIKWSGKPNPPRTDAGRLLAANNKRLSFKSGNPAEVWL